MNSSTISVIDMCLSGLRGLHPQLDEVIPAGTLQDPTTVTISSITITTGDGMPRMRTFRETTATSRWNNSDQNLLWQDDINDEKLHVWRSRADQRNTRQIGIQFETYVKSKDLDLWHVITNGDFEPIQQNPKTKLDEVIPFEKQSDDLKKSKNSVRKFLRALHPKWRAKVTTSEESKDLTSLSVDELIRNLKVHDMIIKKDSEIVKAKKRLPEETSKSSSREEVDFDPNHLIGECPKPPKDKNQRAFVEGSWSDSGEEEDKKVKDETCLVAQASNELYSDSSYFSDKNSSIDDLGLDS
ncbi:hypothetical protein Tco_1164050 [Tanacetum coccineum]